MIVKGKRIYLDVEWYLVRDGNRGYLVYKGGEYEGRYVGSLETLKTMSDWDALDYVLKSL